MSDTDRITCQMPCPACGTEAVWHGVYDPDRGGGTRWTSITCPSCEQTSREAA